MFVHQERVRFFHTDAMKVTHHANYLRWFESARVEFFRAAGVALSDLMADGIVFPILHVEIDYIHASYYDDILEVRTRLIKLTKAQVVFAYEIVRPKDQTIIVRGKTQGTFTSTETGKIIRMPQRYFDKLSAVLEVDDDGEARGY